MSNYRFVTICKYLFLIAPMLGTLSLIPRATYPAVIPLVLLLVTNSQLRQFVTKNSFLITSLLIETGLTVYLGVTYQGFFFLIFFATSMDACTILKFEAYLLVLLNWLGLMFTASQGLSLSYVVVVCGFYLATVLFLMQLRKEYALRLEMEGLYDQIRKNHYDLELARARLLAYSRQVEHVTQLEERNRISRELHDSIGHGLTGTLFQLEAAVKILEIDKAKGLQLLNGAYQNINASIEMVRSTVKKIRPALYRSRSDYLREMIEKFQTSTGVKVELKTSGIPFKLYPSVETALYQNIQEALTNAVRHGSASNIVVNHNFKNEGLEVVISDNGRGSSEINKGFGLSGMEERLELIGGSIKYNGQDGFHIHMCIPRKEW